MHLAILDEELPYPLTSGKRIRTLNLLRRLAGRHRITYLAHRNADPKEASQAERHLRDLGICPILVDRSVPPKSGPTFYARLLANLWSPLPYSVASHASPEMRSAVVQFSQREQVDLWHCEWTPYAEMMKSLPGARWLVVAHNVESLIWQRYAENEVNPLKRWYIRQQCRKFVAFERWAYSQATHTVAVSPDDADRIRSDYAGRQVSVVDNGVDTEYFLPRTSARRTNEILFLGSLDWRPNLDGVQQMFDTVLPRVRASIPDVKFCVVGRNPPGWLRDRATQPGVEVHADVPDVRPFLARASVLAVPLRIGGGSRLKILEALAALTPVVSTRIGAEGLALQPGIHLDAVAGIDPFADALIAALRDPERQRVQALAGRQQVLAHYDWDILAERLDSVWQSVGLPAEPTAGPHLRNRILLGPRRKS